MKLDEGPAGQAAPAPVGYATQTRRRGWFRRHIRGVLAGALLVLLPVGAMYCVRNYEWVEIDTGGVDCEIEYQSCVYTTDGRWTKYLPFGTAASSLGCGAFHGPRGETEWPVSISRRGSELFKIRPVDPQICCEDTSVQFHERCISLQIRWRRFDPETNDWDDGWSPGSDLAESVKKR